MKIAGVQMDVAFADPQANLRRMQEFLKEASAAGAALVAFPECALTGYCFDSLEEARPVAQAVPGPATETMTAACRDAGCFAIFGMLEASGDDVFNAAVLVGPEGVIASYRKVHMPFLGIDRFASYGDRPFSVHEAGDVRLGMLICYDGAFPEAPRCLALQGADLIVLPTNWPPGAECLAESSIATRAMENAIYFMAINRVGTERGVTFIGRSSICSPQGKVLAVGSASAEEILYADIDVSAARQKQIVRVPGKHIIDRIADRRPEMYGPVVAPHDLPRPRDLVRGD